MSLRTPNFVTNEEIVIRFGHYDTKVIPVGAFVRPLEYLYVPIHVKEDSKWSHFDKDRDVFVFCRYGIVAVPKKSIRETM